MAAASVVAGALIGQAAHNDPGGLIVAEGKDRRPSQAAADWVTYADHVVVATADGERETPPSGTEIERGEGLVGREVNLRIDKVLWSREGAPRSAPATWQRASLGWQFKGGDTRNRMKMVPADQPRVESGHRYILAIDWEEAKCSPGDEPEPAQWHTLGEGAVVPYDDDIIGNGEMAGRVQSAERAVQLAAEEGTAVRLEDQLAGQGADELVAALREATPVPRMQFGAAGDATKCG
ncbi:hypothetical protein [Streptomyces sp. NPDC002205]|uniref:hypothetical protein n=1 Tax=Streptomyces sp. NPDC002205 TaxID=3154411 RepID=UPI00332350AE